MTPLRTKVPKLEIVLPPSDDGSSFEIYKAASAAAAHIALPEGTHPREFFVDGVTWQLPQATLTRVRSCAQRIVRGLDEIARDSTPTIQLYLYVAGFSEGECEGRPERLGPGDIVLRDSRRGQAVDVTAFDVRILMVPHDRVPPVFLSPEVHGLRLPGEAAVTRLLAAAIESLLGEIEGLSVAEADHAVLALCQLAVGAIETQLATRERPVGPPLEAAMAYIERRCFDADLTPEAVRAYLGLSRSSLYRLFAPLGGIEAAIRQRRLDHAMRTLLVGGAATRARDKVALSHGFRSETQFVRAFQARFGATPSQARAKIAHGDQAWLEAQAGRAGFDSLQAWLATLASGTREMPDRSDA